MKQHSPSSPTRASHSGFTLVELMITLAVIGILAAAAWPSYQSNLARGYRADARTQLMMAAQFMQRFYAANDSYKQDRAATPNTVLSQMPVSLMSAPSGSTVLEGNALYSLSIPAASLTDMKFTLLMTPVAGGKMATDECGAYALDATGIRTVWIKGIEYGRTASTTNQRDKCWK